MYTRGMGSDCIFQGKKDNRVSKIERSAGYLIVSLWKSTSRRWLSKGTLFHWIGQVNNNLLCSNLCKTKQTVCPKVWGMNPVYRYSLNVYQSGIASIIGKTLGRTRRAGQNLTHFQGLLNKLSSGSSLCQQVQKASL